MKFHLHVGGGRIVPDPEFPWAVAVGRKQTDGLAYTPYCGYFGGGVAVAERWVLSAAHCFQKLGGFDASGRLDLAGKSTTVRVTLDKHLPDDLRAVVDERIVDLIVRHPGFRFNEALNDVALIRLTSPCAHVIRRATSYPKEGTTTVVWGWGETSLGGRPADRLHQAPVIVRSKAVCAAQDFVGGGCHFIGDPSMMIAAGGQDGQGVSRASGTCPGDSGGGLVIEVAPNDFELVGIASWTDRRCGDATGTPDVYAFVPAYEEWIKKTVAGNS
jgi:secreted trypsin-like serine protease